MGECLIIRGGGGTDTSNANATSAVVLTGYTCYVDDQLIVGSMPVQTLNQKLGAGGSVTIPAGYYDGTSSVISTSTLAEETAATAASSHILTGYTGWSNGGWVAGNMANWGNTGATLAANGVYWIPAGWHAGAGVVNQSLAVHGGGTYTPTTGDQVICWAGWYAAGNIVVLGSSSLSASNIRNGVTIFGVTGTDKGSNVIFGNGGQGSFLGGCKFLRQYDVKRYDGQTLRSIYHDTQTIIGGRLRYDHAYWITRSSSTNERRFFTSPGVLINNPVQLSAYSNLRIKFQIDTPYVGQRIKVWWYSSKPSVQWGHTTWGSIDPNGTNCGNLVSTRYTAAGTYDVTCNDLSKFSRTGGWWVITLPYYCNSEGIYVSSIYTYLDFLYLW